MKKLSKEAKETLSKEEEKDTQIALKNVKEGKITSIENVAKQLRLILR